MQTAVVEIADYDESSSSTILKSNSEASIAWYTTYTIQPIFSLRNDGINNSDNDSSRRVSTRENSGCLIVSHDISLWVIVGFKDSSESLSIQGFDNCSREHKYIIGHLSFTRSYDLLNLETSSYLGE